MKKILYLALVLLAAFAAGAFLLPKQVHVERSVVIDRPAAMLFALLDGYRYFDQWSPWEGRDPDAKFIISGPERGVGARLSWVGNPQLVGSGWQEIVASKPYERIDIRLDFEVQGVADTGYLLEAQGHSTRVTWFFDSDVTEGVGPLDALLARYFGLLFDRWVGTDYELGLVRLKQFAESVPESSISHLAIERVEVAAQDILYVTASSSQDPADIADTMARAYNRLGDFMNQSGVARGGPPMAITRSWVEGGYVFDAAIPVDSVPGQLPDGIMAGRSPAGEALKAVHKGPYDQMMPTYEKLAAYMAAHGLREGGASWEQYMSDPAVTPQAGRVTHVYIMLEPAPEP